MKNCLQKIVLFFLCFIAAASFETAAQNLTGIWRGYFITEGSDQYKFEVQIGQSKSNVISGVSYSYLTTVFYGKATLTGNYNKGSKKALVQEIRTVELRMSGSSVACIMKCNLIYSKSGKEEFLEGHYTSMYEKSDPDMGIARGGDCGGGKVFLRKVTTSDFYVEPFLRNPATQTPTKKTTTTPKKTTPKKKPVVKPPVKTETKKDPPVEKKQNKDTLDKIDTETVKETPKVVPKPFKMPAQTRARKNELVQTVDVENEEIIIKLYDNGEIDGDSISVYMDDEIILSNKMLTASPLTIKLKMDESKPEHVLIMVAENLGRIPPNTSLMIINDGENRYRVQITSTEQKNAMVRFRYQKKGN